MKKLAMALLLTSGCADPPQQRVSPEVKAEAAKIWYERCANCHGDFGRGDGVGARILPVRPRDLTNGAWQTQVDDARIRQVIVEGGLSVGLDTNMAANPDLRAKPEVADGLVEIVRDLGRGGPPARPQ